MDGRERVAAAVDPEALRGDGDFGAFSLPEPGSDDAPQGGGQDGGAVHDPVPPSAQRPLWFPEFMPGAEVDGERPVCSARKTTMYLYGAFLELVRQLYRDRTPYIKGVPPVRWLGQARRDGIWIDTEYNWNQDRPEFLPAIYVKLSQIGYQSELGPVNREADMVLKDGVRKYQRSGRGTVTFVHVSGTAGEAVALCDNTRAYLSDFCAAVAEDLCLDEFWESAAAPLAPAQKDSRDRYMSSTSFTYSFYEEWGVKVESPILKSVDVLQGGRRYGILSTGGRPPCTDEGNDVPVNAPDGGSGDGGN